MVRIVIFLDLGMRRIKQCQHGINVTVHVYGEFELLEDEQELMDTLHDMVAKYESPDSSYSLKNVDAEFLSNMNKGVQGFKLKINKVEGKAKLSQNHSLHRKELIINQIEQNPNSGEQQIASLIKANLKNECQAKYTPLIGKINEKNFRQNISQIEVSISYFRVLYKYAHVNKYG